MSATNSAASSQRAWAAAPGGLTWPRTRAACAADLPANTAVHQIAQHRVQPAGGLVAGPGQIPVPPGPYLQHHGMTLGGYRARGPGPQR